MSGKEIRNILFNNGIQHKIIYEGLNISQQSFSQMLNSDNVKSGLLEDIVRVLGVNMSFFYPEIAEVKYEQVSNNDNRDVSAQNIGTLGTGNGTVNTGADNGILKEVLEQNRQLMEQNRQLVAKLLG